MISDCFSELLSQIEPDDTRRQTASEIPGDLREYLQETDDLPTTHPHTRLTGSYKRETTIGDIKDVDILVFLDWDKLEGESIKTILNRLKRALRNVPVRLTLGAEPEVRNQRRSIHLALPFYDIELDVVPVRMTSDDHTDVLLVPDRDWDKWVKTHPLGYGKKLNKLNADNGKKVVPLIKLVKHWRDVNFTVSSSKPKSYWLEAKTADLFDAGRIDTSGKGYADLVLEVLKMIFDDFKPKLETEEDVPVIKDPILGNNVAFNWERSHFETFMNKLKSAVDNAKKAVDAEDNETKAKYWKKVFGENFPTVNEAANAMSSAVKAGVAGVSATGRVSVSPTKTDYSSRPTKFFGEE